MSFKRKLKREKRKNILKQLQELIAAQEEFGGEIVQKENGDISWLSPWEFSEGFGEEQQGEEK
jgi:hypothetical protein